MNKPTVCGYLGHLAEINRLDIDKLDEEDMATMTVRLLAETPTKYLPKVEDYDPSREIATMMSGWIESEDEYLGYQILSKMRDLTIKAMTPVIEDTINDYAKREEAAMEQARKDREADIYCDNRQRI